MWTTYLFILACSVRCSYQRSSPQDDHYVAAVVEYGVVPNETYNVNKYTELITEAAQQNADIVVFPELTLNTEPFAVPLHGLVKEHPVPALSPELFDDTIVAMSQAARNNQIYVVLNGQEVMNCTTDSPGELCPEQKVYYFNTNVVFDRTGAIIDRYRKINLFGERSRTPALRPELGLFSTDFGVTFGHFVCFDLMFQVPAVQVVQKHQLTDVIFTTMWFSELPYLTAVQIQESYAYSMNVNFLASGANRPSVGSAGSGIYSGKAGALVSIMPGVPTTRLLVAKVPKVPGQVSGPIPGPIYDNPTTHDELLLITDPSLRSHVSKPLTDGAHEFVLKDKDVSCSFKIKLKHSPKAQVSTELSPEVCEASDVTTSIFAPRERAHCGLSVKSYKYRAGAFSGVRSFSGVSTGGSRVCSVVACTGDSMDTCGMRFLAYEPVATAEFEELTIEASFPTPVRETDLQADDTAVFPLALKTSIMPLEPKSFAYEATAPEGNYTHYKLTLTDFTEEIYSFAVWARVYATDGQAADPPLKGNAASSVSMLTALVLPCIALIMRA